MRTVDFLVVGAGIAGLRAAIGLAEALGPKGRILVVTKAAMAESNTAYAQGGIAVAMGGEHDVALHLEDTLVAGDGLVDRHAAEVLVREGPARVEELLAWGTAFDRYAKGPQTGDLMRTREGAHSLPRILHADGDATGRVIALALLAKARSLPQIELLEFVTTSDLLLANGEIVGASILTHEGHIEHVFARAVLLASGGAGQVYSDTTNPQVATGDGIAMALRAGAELMDLEFYQFHPTAIALPDAPRFLLSEALRGEGARLVNAQGERFMSRYDARLELAPRDIVARAIAAEAMVHGPVSLDMREVAATMDLAARFPGISRFLAGYGLSLAHDLIPVGPAAHYLMGGVRTDVFGHTSLPRLYAAGETACTGVHGANRLASNSLLEGLVFGAKAVGPMLAEHPLASTPSASVAPPPNSSSCDPAVTAQQRRALQAAMWRDAGLLRDRSGLLQVQAFLEEQTAQLPQGAAQSALELRNLHGLSLAMARTALSREESRGSHYRLDFPGRWPEPLHSVLAGETLTFSPVDSVEHATA